MRAFPRPALVLLVACVLLDSAFAQKPLSPATRGQPNLLGNIERPLRYHPEGQDFVIENGGEFFNRPLYGGNTAFRVDAGDQPEFSLYLPGHAGNLRFGIKSADGAKWLHETARIVARYRPGTLLYEISDPLLGPRATLRLHVIALHQTDGLVVRVECTGLAAPVELIAAYGGVSGKRGARDGDIGTEAVPISQYFQLKPESCEGNSFIVGKASGEASFTLLSKPATILGLMPAGSTLALADATQWKSLSQLLADSGASGTAGSATDKTPKLAVITSRIQLTPASAASPLYFCLQRIQEAGAPATVDELSTYQNVTTDRAGIDRKPAIIPLAPAYRAIELPKIFDEADRHFSAIRSRVQVETPDPFINAAVAALNVGVDAVWDEPQGAVMHGAIAWRSKLLGWRGPYAPDALGWHDRARRHLSYWATRQNTDPVPAKLPPPDEDSNLSRSEVALHSNGDMSNSHYDMNTIYIDALFRHLQWTGDLEYGRSLWPIIERHLAWERRLFRREFGPEKLPLYEAYAVIWASDDLYYSGGGAAHSTAYNYYHNLQAARLARLLGKDASLYETEAKLIARGMRELLWVPELGMFAECKDLLGLQRVHPSAALWTFYHTMDADLVTPAEGERMVQYLQQRIPSIPVRGPGVPAERDYRMYATSDWMPYSWSINNVVMGESLHAALGCWQAGQPEEAFRNLKASLMASMFMGISPGNVGTLNYLDVYRRETQRDFADGGGVGSRAIVEGLFGIRPDALSGELLLSPGFPSGWDHASIQHPDLSVSFKREGATDRYIVEQRFAKPLSLRLQLAGRAQAPQVTVNGQAVTSNPIPGTELAPRLEIKGATAARYELIVRWNSPAPSAAPGPRVAKATLPRDSASLKPYDWTAPLTGRTESVDLSARFNDRVTRIFKNEYRSPRSPFVSLSIPKQGIGAWAGHVKATAEIDDRGLRAIAKANGNRFTLPSGLSFATPGTPDARNILFTSLWDNYPKSASVPLSGKARRLFLLMAGSTNFMQSRIDNGEVVVTYKDGSTARLGLRNPDTWWPIEQDYLVDDFQFRMEVPPPPRLDLKTGLFRPQDRSSARGRTIPGGAATFLELPLDDTKELLTLTVRTLSNDVVVGLMSATLLR